MKVLEQIAKTTGRPVAEVVDVWGERAAIREYDGGMRREDAELAAVEDTRSLLSARIEQVLA